MYSSPVVRLPSNETVTLPIEWDGENSAISVKLPEGSPLIVAFGVAAKLPKSKRDFLALLFPWLKFGASGTVEDGEDDKGKVNSPLLSFQTSTDLLIRQPKRRKLQRLLSLPNQPARHPNLAAALARLVTDPVKLSKLLG